MKYPTWNILIIQKIFGQRYIIYSDHIKMSGNGYAMKVQIFIFIILGLTNKNFVITNNYGRNKK